MRWKTAVVVSLVLIVALFVGLYLVIATYDYDKLIPGIVKSAKEGTGRELVVSGHARFKIGLSPEFILRDVTFQNASWGSRPDMARAEELGLQLALWPLLRGDFEVTGIVLNRPDIMVEVDRSGRSNLNFETEEKTSAEGVAKAVDDLQVADGLLTYKDWRSGKTFTLRVDRLRALPIPFGKLAFLDLHGAVNGQTLRIDGTAGRLGAFLRPGEPWPADLTAKAGSVRVTAHGELADAEHLKGFAFRLAAEGSSVAEVAAFVGFTGRADLGPFSAQAELADAAGAIGLKNVNFGAGSRESLKVQLTGSVGDIVALRQVDLAFSASSDKLAKGQKVGASFPAFRGSFTASGRISDSAADAYRVQDLKVALGKESLAGTLSITMIDNHPQVRADLSSPKFFFGPLRLGAIVTGLPARPVGLASLDLVWGSEDLAELRLEGSIADLAAGRGVNVASTLQGKDLAALLPITGRKLPLRGAFSVSAQVTDVGEKRYQVSQLELVVGGNHLAGSWEVDLSGERPRVAATLSSPSLDLGALLQSAGVEVAQARPLPDLGPLSLAFTLFDPAGKPRIEELDLRAGSTALMEVEVRGGVRDLSSGRALDLQVTAKGRNVAELEQIVGRPLPLEGPYALSGRLLDPDPKVYQVRDLRLDVGRDHLGGSLECRLTGGGPRLSLALSSPAFTLRSLKAGDGAWLGRLKSALDLGPLALTLLLSGSEGHWSLEALDAQVGSEAVAVIGLKGSIQDLAAFRGLNLEMRCRGKDAKGLEKIIGRPVAPVGAYGISVKLLDPEPGTYEGRDLSLVWGESDLSGRFQVKATGERPEVTAALSSGRLDVRPFLSGPGKEQRATEEGRPTGEKKERVFSSEPLPFRWLDRLEGKIEFRVGHLLLPRVALDNLFADLVLRNGTLEVEPLTFAVGGGAGDCRLKIGYEENGAAVTLTSTMKEIQVGPMLDELGYERNLEGSLDADLRLSGRGNSMAEIMAGLEGNIYLVMGNGRAAVKYLTMLNSDLQATLLRLINPFQKQTAFTDFNCFVNRVEVHDGSARWKLLLDTEQTTIVAAGDIDLKTEEIDIGIKPSPKTGYGLKGLAQLTLGLNELAKPLKLGGTLANPSFTVDPVQAGLTIGKALGGFALFGPFGLITALADLKLGGKDACLKAIEKAQARQQAGTNEKGTGPSTGQEGDAGAKKKGGFWKRVFGL